MQGDEIRLALPADPEYGRLARITASGLALRLGLGFADIEDLRLAVDEALILLLRPGRDGDRIAFVFKVEPTRLSIDAETEHADDADEFDQDALTRFEEIVGDTVDRFRIGRGRVHLEKARPLSVA